MDRIVLGRVGLVSIEMEWTRRDRTEGARTGLDWTGVGERVPDLAQGSKRCITISGTYSAKCIPDRAGPKTQVSVFHSRFIPHRSFTP